MPRPSEDGFTLLEAVVALAILALAVIAIYQSGGALAALVTRSGLQAQAVAHAQSRLAALCHGGALVARTDTDDDGNGFNYAYEVRALGSQQPSVDNSDDANPAPPQRITLYQISVTITHEGQRTLTLVSNCLGQNAIGSAGAP